MGVIQIQIQKKKYMSKRPKKQLESFHFVLNFYHRHFVFNLHKDGRGGGFTFFKQLWFFCQTAQLGRLILRDGLHLKYICLLGFAGKLKKIQKYTKLMFKILKVRSWIFDLKAQFFMISEEIEFYHLKIWKNYHR